MASFSVLIPVDGSENSEKAFDWYLKYCHKPENLVIMFHAHEPPSLPSFRFKAGLSVPTDEWEAKIKAGIEEVQKLENSFVARCQSLGINYKFFSENSSKPGEAICSFAKEKNVDLIVMGTRGLGTIRRTFLGSVSDYVLHHSDRPISVIPLPAPPATSS